MNKLSATAIHLFLISNLLGSNIPPLNYPNNEKSKYPRYFITETSPDGKLKLKEISSLQKVLSDSEFERNKLSNLADKLSSITDLDKSVSSFPTDKESN